jgi:hypothetical protein
MHEQIEVWRDVAQKDRQGAPRIWVVYLVGGFVKKTLNEDAPHSDQAEAFRFAQSHADRLGCTVNPLVREI